MKTKIVVVVVALALAFAGGFFTARRGPTPDKITEHVVEDKHTATIEDVHAATKIDEHKTTARVRDTKARTVTETTKPDGTKVRTERTIERVEHAGSAADTAVTNHRDSSTTTDVLSHSERLTITEYRRDWRATVLVGAQLTNPLHNGGNPFAPTLLLGVSAERRLNFIPLIGDRLWAGIFVAGNLPLNVPLADVRQRGAIYAGVSLGVEF